MHALRRLRCRQRARRIGRVPPLRELECQQKWGEKRGEFGEQRLRAGGLLVLPPLDVHAQPAVPGPEVGRALEEVGKVVPEQGGLKAGGDPGVGLDECALGLGVSGESRTEQSSSQWLLVTPTAFRGAPWSASESSGSFCTDQRSYASSILARRYGSPTRTSSIPHRWRFDSRGVVIECTLPRRGVGVWSGTRRSW